MAKKEIKYYQIYLLLQKFIIIKFILVLQK